MWNNEALKYAGTNGVKFWIRFPDSRKIDCCVASTASTKV